MLNYLQVCTTLTRTPWQRSVQNTSQKWGDSLPLSNCFSIVHTLNQFVLWLRYRGGVRIDDQLSSNGIGQLRLGDTVALVLRRHFDKISAAKSKAIEVETGVKNVVHEAIIQCGEGSPYELPI